MGKQMKLLVPNLRNYFHNFSSIIWVDVLNKLLLATLLPITVHLNTLSLLVYAHNQPKSSLYQASPDVLWNKFICSVL